MSWYANPLWVDPTNPDFLVTGGYNFYKSTDGGAHLTQISAGYIMSQQPHVDNHVITGDPGFDGINNKAVYVGTDGGVWRTEDIYTASTTSGWAKLDASYRTVQFYAAAGDGPSGRILGGTQDNGTLRLAAGNDQAHLTFGGDGGFCAIDATNANYCYGEYVNLRIHRSTDGGLSAQYIYSGIADAGASANFVAPFVLDPNNANTMLAGGASLWRSNNVKASTPAWQSIRGPGSDYISAIAVAPGSSNVIWIGQNNGEVHRTANGTAGTPTWSAVDNNGSANPLPNRYVERILIDPDDPDVVYVSFGGFSEDNLWKTEDHGVTWADITGDGPTGLPDAPINGLARHPNRSDWLYAGTEVGVFASADGGATWSTQNEGPANASVDDLLFMHHSHTLLAVTHGRGIFTVDIPADIPFNFDGDGVVDEEDFVAFGDCFTGPEGDPLPPECTPGDVDGDGDIDCDDWSRFVDMWGGAGDPPSFVPCLFEVPALGDWGLVASVLLLLTAASVLIRKHAKASSGSAYGRP
ncbi:MAG: hypothetical protein J5J06_16445 [Phycisphaerae bacterium]|nr:hypothetical protein [Phycisphaerae bacterium]